MRSPGDAPPSIDTRFVVWLLIVVAIGIALGRLASAERLYEPSIHTKRSEASGPPPRWPATPPKPMPTFGSNDRSRWATIASLVDRGTFVIGERSPPDKAAVALFAATTPLEAITLNAVRLNDRGIIFEDGWQSVDKVLHPTRGEFYSSKPPLLTVLMAGAYWPLHNVLGLSLEREPFIVVRILVGLLNVLPLTLYLWLLYWLGERYATRSWTALFLVAAGAFGTLVNPFLITFNNHVPAVYGTLFLLATLLKIDREGSGAHLGWYALAGLLGGLNATNELPALAFTGIAFLVAARVSLRNTLIGFVPAALLPLAALYGLNYVVLGQFAPAYSETATVWYQYEGSHWLLTPGVEPKRGIDFARFRESKAEYAFHLLIGHHGFLSLTPIFLLSLVGLFLGLRRPDAPAREDRPTLPWWLSPAVLLVSVVVIGFYIVRSDNYGGWTNGPRWLLWLVPLWLVSLIPAVDRLAASKRGRAFALVLLVLSIFSASYFDWSPWRHPWIYNLLDSAGKIPY
jgi:hypothetical protein